MSAVIVFVVAGVGTALIRSSFVLIDGRSAATVWIETHLQLVGSAVLAAIVTSSLIVRDGGVGLPGMAELVAVLFALVIVRRTQNVALALVVGLPIYWAGALAGLA